MSAPSCHEELRRLLALRESDALTPDDARQLREHLAGCDSCRGTALESDPTLLFLALAGEEEPAERRGPRRASPADLEAERLVADVLAAVEVERVRRRLSPKAASASLFSGRHLSRAVLRAASIALLGGVLGALYLARQPLRELLGVRAKPAAVEMAAVRPSQLGAAAPAVTAARAARPVLEDLKNPGATVYEFASSSPQEPTVVFVVDPNADL